MVMDAPLLALTRSTTSAQSATLRGAPAAENMRQLIQLRWIAVVGQLLAVLISCFGLGMPLPIAPMVGIIGLLAIINLVFSAGLRRAVKWDALSLSLSLTFDMAALTGLLFLSGGSNNPFISLYLVQVVLGAILLPRIIAGLLAIAACVAYASLSMHYWPLDLPTAAGFDLLQLGQLVAFTMVAVLLVLFIARISRNLRARDDYLAELRQRAIEEEGIIRMGLFASGAAHELGTPLSSLSVLVADWRRHRAFAGDRELALELTEASAEVDRCKRIVSNILHSAGSARGEAMGSVRAWSLVDEVVQEWTAAHPGVPFDRTTDALAMIRIPDEPALRQAVWSLLENAAEASPGAVSLTAKVEEDAVVIAVLDRGPGFGPNQLRTAGQLFQSTKGPGHGLGLFLAGNVARQLGGSLHVANRDSGGAAVRLILPMASPGNGQ